MVTLIICIGVLSIFSGALWWRVNSLSYELYVPESPNPKSMPALVVLHGAGGDAFTTQQWLGFDLFAEKHGFVVIYPNSKYDQWDAGVGVFESGNSKYRKVDHAQYLNRIIDKVSEHNPINKSRVMIGGMSDGAAMAIHASCRFPEVFSGVFSVAATIPIYAIKNCSSANSMPALFMHGMQDDVLPWDGKYYKGYKIYLPFQESIGWWLARNKCSQKADERYLQFAGEVEWKRFADCQDDAHVTVFKVNNGGHSWPQRVHPKARTSGTVNQDIDATKIIVEWAMALN